MKYSICGLAEKLIGVRLKPKDQYNLEVSGRHRILPPHRPWEDLGETGAGTTVPYPTPAVTSTIMPISLVLCKLLVWFRPYTYKHKYK